MRPWRFPKLDRHLVCIAVAWLATNVASSQPVKLDGLAAATAGDCGSVVIVQCDRPASLAGETRPSKPPAARRIEERRRAAVQPIELDRIVIEGEGTRRSLQEALSAAFVARAAGGTETSTVAEGSLCTCMNRCPPPPFPCCECSPHMSRYGLMPGASPLR